MTSLFIALPLALLLPLQAGIMARSFGRRFWLWFLVTIPLPVIGNYILLCLGDSAEIKLNDKEKAAFRISEKKKSERFIHKTAPVTVNA